MVSVLGWMNSLDLGELTCHLAFYESYYLQLTVNPPTF